MCTSVTVFASEIQGFHSDKNECFFLLNVVCMVTDVSEQRTASMCTSNRMMEVAGSSEISVTYETTCDNPVFMWVACIWQVTFCVTVAICDYLVFELKETYRCPATVFYVNVVDLPTWHDTQLVSSSTRVIRAGGMHYRNADSFSCVNIGLVLTYTDDVSWAADKLYRISYLRLDK